MNVTSEKIAKCRIDTLEMHRDPLVAMRMLDGLEPRDEQEIPATTIIVRGNIYIYVFALPAETADKVEYEPRIRHRPQTLLVGRHPQYGVPAVRANRF